MNKRIQSIAKIKECQLLATRTKGSNQIKTQGILSWWSVQVYLIGFHAQQILFSFTVESVDAGQVKFQSYALQVCGTLNPKPKSITPKQQSKCGYGICVIQWVQTPDSNTPNSKEVIPKILHTNPHCTCLHTLSSLLFILQVVSPRR